MFRLRMIGKILHMAKMGHITVVFLATFAAAAAIIDAICPEITTYTDALWLCFQTVTTIGFGDVYTKAPLVRVILVCLSIISIFYLAIITGVVVAYVTEAVRVQTRESLTKLQDDLEHLDEKTPEELREISARVAKLRKRGEIPKA